MSVTIKGDGTVSTGLNADQVDGTEGSSLLTQTQLDTKVQSIRVNYDPAGPIKEAGHANLGVPGWVGNGSFRVTHSQGDTNFVVQVTRINSRQNFEGVPELTQD